MLNPILLSVLSALLYVLSFAPWDLGPLQWFAFVPLLVASKHSPFKMGFITQFLICLGGFYWIAYSVERYSGMPAPVSYAVLALFCCFGQLQIPIYLWVRSRLLRSSYFTKKPLLWPTLGALLYVGIESIYPKLFSDTAGNAFYKMQWTRQAAELGGPFILTFCSIFINELVYYIYKNRSWKKAWIPITFLLALNLAGAIRTQQVQTALNMSHLGPKLNVALIQANIGDYLKLASEQGSSSATKEVMDQYLGLSQQAALSEPKPDLIVWPETAYPSVFGKSRTATDFNMEQKLRTFATSFPNTIAFGGYDTDLEARDYNSLFFYRHGANQNDPEIYHKAILLQFGETLPGAEYFPSLKKNFPTMGFFGQGPGPQVISVPKNETIFKVAPSICYEALFPKHAAMGSELQSDFFLNVTNDSWFGPYGEPYLHLALSTYRSIENREYMVRSTNTGISAIIDPTGEITQSTGLFAKEILSASIPKRLEIKRVPAIIPVMFLYFCQLVAGLSLAYTVVNRNRLI